MPKLPYSQPSTPGCCRHQDRHAGSGRSGSGCFPTPWLTSPPLASTQNLRTGIAFKWGEHRLRITDQHPIPSHPHGRAPGVLGGGGGSRVAAIRRSATRRRLPFGEGGAGLFYGRFFPFLIGVTYPATIKQTRHRGMGVPSMYGEYQACMAIRRVHPSHGACSVA